MDIYKASNMSGTKCSIPGCHFSRRNNKRLFGFSTRRTNINAWLSVCNMSFEQLVSGRHFVCEDHFEHKFIRGRKLAGPAVPTLNINRQ